MFWERDVLVKQEQMKDRLRRRKERRLLATASNRLRAEQPQQTRRPDVLMVIRALRQKLLAG